jgi:hypothetical protein
MSASAILYGLGMLAGASGFIQALFRPKYRQASRWFRAACVILASVAIAWSGLGFFLLAQSSHLSQAGFSILDHIKSGLAGMLVGMSIFIFIHPDYRKLRSSQPPSP